MDVVVHARRTASGRVDRDVERVVANAANLVEVRGDIETVVAASTYVEEHGFTPFDAMHLVESEGDAIVTSDGAYEGFSSRLDLKAMGED